MDIIQFKGPSLSYVSRELVTTPAQRSHVRTTKPCSQPSPSSLTVNTKSTSELRCPTRRVALSESTDRYSARLLSKKAHVRKRHKDTRQRLVEERGCRGPGIIEQPVPQDVICSVNQNGGRSTQLDQSRLASLRRRSRGRPLIR